MSEFQIRSRFADRRGIAACSWRAAVSWPLVLDHVGIPVPGSQPGRLEPYRPWLHRCAHWVRWFLLPGAGLSTCSGLPAGMFCGVTGRECARALQRSFFSDFVAAASFP